jgi:hypothetical protein
LTRIPASSIATIAAPIATISAPIATVVATIATIATPITLAVTPVVRGFLVVEAVASRSSLYSHGQRDHDRKSYLEYIRVLV